MWKKNDLGNSRQKNYETCAAEIPRFQPEINPIDEYADFREERIWNPMSENNEVWIPQYIYKGQSVLTDNQQVNGVPAMEALENSCNDSSLEYILQVLSESNGNPMVALKRLKLEKLPKELMDNWRSDDLIALGEGLSRHRKNFSEIQRNFLPHKTTLEITKFYYAWKRSGRVTKGLVASRARRYFKDRPKPSNLVLESLHNGRILTRSRTSIKHDSTKHAKSLSIDSTKKKDETAPKRKRRRQTIEQ